jgi:small subunit ribosomal protein S9
MEKENYQATGRRKASVARATLVAGKGGFTINGHDLSDYLDREVLVEHAREPLAVAEMMEKLDIRCSANGGGKAGQAGAVRLAVSRALLVMDPELRASLRKAGMLTRDARVVERKKYGQPKARKRFQYSKR